MTLHHPDRMNIDEFLQSSYPNSGGHAKDRPILPAEWTDSAGVALVGTTTGTVGRAAINLGTTDLLGIQWNTTAGASDIAHWTYQLPMDYNPTVDKLRLVVMVRKTKASDENTNLALVCNAKWFDSASTAGEALSAVIQSAALAAATAGTDWDDFEEVIFDLDGHGLKPGAILQLELYPHEQVGSSTMVLDMISARLDYRGGVSHHDRDLRSWA